MRIVFSRKGFDSSYGGAPSPIIEGRPVSLPIPGSRGEVSTYGQLGLGGLVEAATRSRLGAASACHDDPMFADGRVWFGQVNAAQGHLRKQGVGAGDVFLFFGLFAEPDTGERHHRIFGYMRVACHGAPSHVRAHADWREPPRPHPHLSGAWEPSNTLYHGPGMAARTASPALRLTRPGGPLNLWAVPQWLCGVGLTYHGKPGRWPAPGLLDSARRGQEFVCDIGGNKEARRWLNRVIGEIEGP